MTGPAEWMEREQLERKRLDAAKDAQQPVTMAAWQDRLRGFDCDFASCDACLRIFGVPDDLARRLIATAGVRSVHAVCKRVKRSIMDGASTTGGGGGIVDPTGYVIAALSRGRRR